MVCFRLPLQTGSLAVAVALFVRFALPANVALIACPGSQFRLAFVNFGGYGSFLAGLRCGLGCRRFRRGTASSAVVLWIVCWRAA